MQKDGQNFQEEEADMDGSVSREHIPYNTCWAANSKFWLMPKILT
jgi:hypothetical protein